MEKEEKMVNKLVTTFTLLLFLLLFFAALSFLTSYTMLAP
jgi:hypothetical protein